MRLSIFIRTNLECILLDWEAFARSIQPSHKSMNVAELRDHAEEMLLEIAADLERPYSDAARLERARGRGVPRGDGDTAAEVHAALRMQSGFDIAQLIAEYRALRASVLHLWSNRAKTATWFEFEDMTRFNEAIDQALCESVARYADIERQGRDIFLGILGHDIRTPLSAISMSADMLMQTESLDDKSSQLASRIARSSKRIGSLVTDLLDFTQARFGMKLSIRLTDLGLVAEGVAEEIRSVYPDRTIDLAVAGRLDGSWDGERIAEALSNLICNALQHGMQTAPVSVSVKDAQDAVELAVHNLGTPIPGEEIGYIFEPLRRYARASGHGRGAHRNLGLGLYVAREVVHAHGGRIGVVSTASEGTTFTMHLPRLQN